MSGNEIIYVGDAFKEVFHNNKELLHKLKTVSVIGIELHKKTNNIIINLFSKEVKPYVFILKLEDSLTNFFKKKVQVKIKFDVKINEDILKSNWENIVLAVNRKFSSCRGIFVNSEWCFENSKLKIKFKTRATSYLLQKHCDKYIEELLNQWFGEFIKVEFNDLCSSIEMFEDYVGYISKEEEKVNDVVKVISIDKPKQEKKQYTPKAKEFRPKKVESDAKPKSVIIGKGINENLSKIIDINLESGKVAFEGEVFSIDQREIRSGKILYMVDMTDFSSSISVKFFTDKEKVPEIKEKLKVGSYIKVKGDAQYDKFSKELSIFASDILEYEREEKMDTAEEKRVELHLHTQMSSMDAVTPAKELVKRAAKWGHRAVAITDHGVVQSFPDASDMAKKLKIKIIYGVECYLVDDVSCVQYSNGMDINGEYVVFDVETTGLNPNLDKIIEIGAVKIKNMQIVDTFSTFVNPEMLIPDFIKNLTKIVDADVEGAPIIDEVIHKFIEFIGEACIVAHNAQFDISFIKAALKKHNIQLSNPILDTLTLSRKLLKDLDKHKLGSVAKYFKISLENAHRAIDDSKATAMIYLKMAELLIEKGVSSIDDIDKVLGDNFDFKKAKTYHAIILVKNYVGLRNLYKIISKSHLDYFFKKPRVLKKMISEFREGLIIGSACEAGELYSAILDGKTESEIKRISEFYDYFEIQPIANNMFLVNNGKVSNEIELQEINKKIIKLGKDNGKLVVATCDVHFIDQKDEVFRRILMAGQGFSDADNQAPLYFRTTNEMLSEFTYLGDELAKEVVITNTNKIADMIDEIIPIPDGTFPPRIEGAEEEIKSLSENKAKEIYGEVIPQIVEERLQKELNSIIKNGFSVMYIIAQKLVWKSVSEGYLVGSRGSVGSSFVANMVGITEVNSLPAHYICEKCKYSEFITDGSVACGFDLEDKECPKCGNQLKKDGYDIPFETFLGFDGDKEPDIDLNFSGEYQPKAHKYTEELFGSEHVFRAGTIATIAEKTAYGFVKNYLDDREKLVTNAEINRLVKGCTGVKRTTGQHPGGLMVVPQDREIFEFCPIQRPADDTDSSIITTHFDYHSISGRLLKLDILGHDDPTVIRMLEDITGINATKIPIGEKRTMSLFSSTEALNVKPEDINSEVGTFAIPEFGTKFVRQMLVDTNPKVFSELIRISGLSHGTDVWLNNAQELVRSGVANLSEVICTRDDIMLYLIYNGLPPKTAFKIMEDVRKGKGLKQEYEDIMNENSVPKWYIDSCKKIKYMFPKAHAAAYVMMAFRIAWFKVYYPEAFYATYFTVRADDFDAEIMTCGKDKVMVKIREYESKGNTLTQKEKNVLAILEVANEMYARGINFIPIDLYLSDPVKFLIEKDGIRPPLNALGGLGTSAAYNIEKARLEGNFISKEDLRNRAKISKTVIECMDKNKCFNDLPDTSQISLF